MAATTYTDKSYILKDGTEIFVRLQLPEDEQHLRNAFEKLSSATKRMRYFAVSNGLSEKDWAHYLNTDTANRVGIVAYKVSNNEIYGLAVARYFRVIDEPEIAEAGITVIDEYHHKGIGKILLTHLTEHGKQNGIKKFRAEIHVSNTPMLEMLKGLPHSTTKLEDNILRLEYMI